MRWPLASRRSDRAAGPLAAAVAAAAFRRGSRNDAASMGGRSACEDAGAGVLVNEAEGAIMVAVSVSGGCCLGRCDRDRERRATPRLETLFEPVRGQEKAQSS